MTSVASVLSGVNELCGNGVSGFYLDECWRHHGGFPYVAARVAGNLGNHGTKVA
jgi:hypothetical protein